MPTRVRTCVKAAAWVVVLLLLLLVSPPAIFVAVECYGPGVPPTSRPAEVERVAAGLKNYYREESATYLTLPEWYIVYSTEEHAHFIAERPPSQFPYLRAIRQYWRYYAKVCRVTKTAYPFDVGIHLAQSVIGVSFSAETALRGAYENTLGRLSERLGGHHTEEDRFAQRTAQEYGRFLHTVPFYEFPFGSRLAALWRETPLLGPNVIRKWERRFALSAEYGIKAAYSWLIRKATGAVYAPEDLEIHVWLAHAPDSIFGDRRVRKVRETAPGSWVVVIPRYEAFTRIVTALARQGARFRDIAGNGEILLTALVPRGWRYTLPTGRVLFSERILTDRATKRIVVYAPVESLHAILVGLESDRARIEHIHDY